MLPFYLTSRFTKFSKLLILISILSGISANAQIKFNEGVIIYKVDSILSDKPIDSSNISIGEIRIYKKNNLRRMDFISPQSTESTPSYIITQILNEKGLYFTIESQLFDNTKKSALFQTIEEIEKSKAEHKITNKIPEFRFKESAKKRTVFGAQVETVYRVEKDPNRTWQLLVAKNIDTSFGFFFTEYLYLTGTPFQFYFDDNTTIYHLTAQSLIEKAIDDDLFVIGKEYDITPYNTKTSPLKKE